MIDVRELTREECDAVLSRARLARLACAKDGQPYVVPVHVAWHELTAGEACLYGYSTAGQKIEWMRANPRGCLLADEIVNAEQWLSVVVYGRFAELQDDERESPARGPARMSSDERREGMSERQLAHQVLASRGTWWEPAASERVALEPSSDGASEFTPIFYKIWIDQVTGRQAMPSASGPQR